MAVRLGPPRSVIPNQNLGAAQMAQRRLAEVAGRAAQKTRQSVAVDAWPCRLYLRNPRGTIPCPCSQAGSVEPGGRAQVILDGGEFDDIGAVDSGYPRGNERSDVSGLELRAESDPDGPSIGETVQRLLVGSGRRCGICWGTGWIDGHRMWGGNRRIMCVQDAPGVTFVDGTVDVDVDSPTPCMVGPGRVTWSLRINTSDRRLDALRVRDQLLPATGGYALEMSNDQGQTWVSPAEALSSTMDGYLGERCIATGTRLVRLTLQQDARVSHVELISRSEPMVNLQLPQLAQVASAELISPFLTEEFELDPIVGFVERGSLMDVQPSDGRVGSLWMVTDVTVKHTAAGQIFGVVGTARTAQPGDVIACASLSDALTSGLMDRGYATRGLEPTGAGVSGGLDNRIDESATAARRGTPPRLGGGRSSTARTIVLSDGEY